jgi:glucose 1-dehydrogenase
LHTAAGPCRRPVERWASAAEACRPTSNPSCLSEQLLMRLTGCKALVTGSSQGIGQAIALRLAKEGADVVVNYRTHPETAKQTVNDIREMGRSAAAIQADVSKVEEAQTLITKSVEALGSLNTLVNNAGIENAASFLETNESDYDRVLGVNLKSAFFATQVFARHRLEVKQGGKVINISSVHEELTFPHFTSYCASKGGLKMLMRNLAIELAPLGIAVNNIAPGAIETPINANLLKDPEKLKAVLGNIPLGRLGRPHDVAGVAAFLASSDADYITGATIFIDGGLTWNYSEP